MQKNEKTAISAKDYGSITNLKNKTTMKQMKINSKENQFVMNDFTSHHEKPQLNFGRPPKVLENIHCCDCHHTRPLDGYRFGLMPLCRDCRTDRELEITGNRFERRRAQR